MFDVIQEIELVHDDGYNGHHSWINGSNQPGGPASLAGTSHNVVGGRQTKSLNLNKC